MKPLNDSARAGLLNMYLGVKVSRATAVLPQGTAAALFTIAGGIVLMTAIYGEVTTAIGGGNATSLQANPTLGTAPGPDLCATLDITSCKAGDLLSITGTPADAMLASHVGCVQIQTVTGIFLQQGTLDLDCAGSVTGNIAWTLFYVPAEEGATVVAA